MAGNRNKSLDAVKGFAILLVMFGHVLILNHLDSTKHTYLYNLIDLIQMPLFMAVSGYIAGLRRRQMDAHNLKILIGKRTVAYLVPFFTWIMIKEWQHPNHIPDAVWATLKQPDRGLWFLLTLYVLTVILFVAQFMEYRFGKVALYATFLVAFALLLLQTKFSNNFLAPQFSLQYMPFFVGAYLITRHQALLLKRLQPRFFKLLFPAAMAGVLAYYFLVRSMQPNGFLFLYRKVAAFLGCYLCFTTLYEAKENSKGIRFLSFLGQYTLEIYVLHFHFATLFPKPAGLSFYSIQGVLYAIGAFVLMSVITAGCIYIVKKVWILDLLLFGKTRKKNPVKV